MTDPSHSHDDGYRPTFCVVTPTYNVERYIERYFQSLFSNRSEHPDFEVVLVDDGSTDRSASIAQAWQLKYPSRIKYVRQPNGGLSAARNLGLDHATARWVTFIDPDDFVAHDYFSAVSTRLKSLPSDCSLLASNLYIYDERSNKTSNTHPLNYRFADRTTIVDLTRKPDYFQLSAASAFFQSDIIQTKNLRFDRRVAPTFEDAHFIARYLTHAPSLKLALVPAALYYYRKRADQSSLVAGASSNRKSFTSKLLFGYLPMLKYRHRSVDQPLGFIAQAILYDLSWHFKELMNCDLSLINPRIPSVFDALLRQVFRYITIEDIIATRSSVLNDFHKTAILARFKGTPLGPRVVEVSHIDHTRALVRLKYAQVHGSKLDIWIDGTIRPPLAEKQKFWSFNGRPYFSERLVWVGLNNGETLSVRIDGVQMNLSYRQQKTNEFRYAAHPKPTGNKPKVRRRILQYIARLPIIEAQYGNCWLLIDRDIQADDNAEHLYRWLREFEPQQRIFFILRRNSHDWPRLKSDGFRLIEYGSVKHWLALLNARWILSSHADNYVYRPLSEKKYSNRNWPRYAFLQHGVTKDDLSRWLNGKPIDLFVTASPMEYKSIVDGPYDFCEQEVVLTGLARHDKLLRIRKEKKQILIMPTWRQSLTGPPTGQGNRRSPDASFSQSDYKKRWEAVISNDALMQLAKSKGYDIAFFPHANMQMYLSEFSAHTYTKILSHENSDIQELFARAAILVTDYSSVAFDVALIGKPVVYYQFDDDNVYRTQPYTRGYFDYVRDGFGEVCREQDTLLRTIAEYIETGCEMKPEYAARAAAFFAFRDGQNCRRIYDAILERDRPWQPGA